RNLVGDPFEMSARAAPLDRLNFELGNWRSFVTAKAVRAIDIQRVTDDHAMIFANADRGVFSADIDDHAPKNSRRCGQFARLSIEQMRCPRNRKQNILRSMRRPANGLPRLADEIRPAYHSGRSMN